MTNALKSKGYLYLPTFNVYHAHYIALFENGEELEDEIEFGYYREIKTMAGKEYLVKREARQKYRKRCKKKGLILDITILDFEKLENESQTT